MHKDAKRTSVIYAVLEEGDGRLRLLSIFMALARLRLSPWRNRVKPLQTTVLKCLLTSISAARPHTSGEPKPLYSALSGSIRAKFTNIAE